LSFFQKLKNAEDLDRSSAFLQNRYKKNLIFFRENIPAYEKLLLQDLRTYNIDLSPDGVNIVNLKTQKNLYEKDEFFSVNEALSLDPIKNPLWNKFITETLITKSEIQTAPITAKITSKIIECCSQDIDYQKDKIQTNIMPPCIIYGVISGLFLEKLADENNFCGLFIYEPNVEFFVLSAYFLDYEKLYQKTKQNSCYIVVGGKLEPKQVQNFFSTRLITNLFFRLELVVYENELVKDARSLVAEISRSTTRGWGTFEDEIIGVKNKLKNYKNYPYLSSTKKIDAPVCVVGNGPSLEKNIELIKKNQDNFIIFSSGSALAILVKYGIKVDFQIEIERMPHVQKWLKNAGLKDVPLICADIVDPSTLESSSKVYLFIRDSSASSNMFGPKFILEFASPIVGNSALSLAINFFSEIYLFGMDLGFKKDAKKHASGSLYDKMNDKSEEILPTRGNFSSNIYTNSLFSLSRSLVEILLKKSSAKVYNLSDGAYIKGAIPATKINLQKLNKEKVKKDFLSSFSSGGFFSNTKINYQENLENYKKNFIKLLCSKKITSKDKLFDIIDAAFFFTIAQRQSEPVSGTLVCGSFWHILNTIFTLCMQIQRGDISELFKDLVDIIEKNVKDFKLE